MIVPAYMVMLMLAAVFVKSAIILAKPVLESSQINAKHVILRFVLSMARVVHADLVPMTMDFSNNVNLVILIADNALMEQIVLALSVIQQ